MSAATGVGCLGSTSQGGAVGSPGIQVAQIGLRSRGREHLQSLGRHVVALCDVDQAILDVVAAEHLASTGVEAAKYRDFRELLEKADVDAVSIATPNHTHCLIAIAAIEAGKDVYCEKPVSQNLWEGRQLVAATRKHGRIVQCGTQSRSSRSLQQAVAWVRGGALGEIEYALGTCYKARKSIGKLSEPLTVPSTVDYDLWCGPAEERPLYRPQLHYDWHWDNNTGNGDMGNQGVHQMDIARWFLGEAGVAPRTISIGGRLGYDDAGNTPNTQVVLHAYETAPLIFETRGLPRSLAGQSDWWRMMDTYRGSGVGVVVQCEGGHILVPSYTEAIAFDLAGKEVRRWSEGGDHFANWLGAVEKNDPSLLSAEIQEGHVSSALCHIGEISHQLGQSLVADEIATAVANDPLLSASFDRMAAHLRSNGVDIDGQAVLTMGPWLDVEASSETFANRPDAQLLRTRDARPSFPIPDYGA